MSLFKMPASVYKRIDKLAKDFLWGSHEEGEVPWTKLGKGMPINEMRRARIRLTEETGTTLLC